MKSHSLLLLALLLPIVSSRLVSGIRFRLTSSNELHFPSRYQVRGIVEGKIPLTTFSDDESDYILGDKTGSGNVTRAWYRDGELFSVGLVDGVAVLRKHSTSEEIVTTLGEGEPSCVATHPTSSLAFITIRRESHCDLLRVIPSTGVVSTSFGNVSLGDSSCSSCFFRSSMNDVVVGGDALIVSVKPSEGYFNLPFGSHTFGKSKIEGLTNVFLFEKGENSTVLGAWEGGWITFDLDEEGEVLKSTIQYLPGRGQVIIHDTAVHSSYLYAVGEEVYEGGLSVPIILYFSTKRKDAGMYYPTPRVPSLSSRYISLTVGTWIGTTLKTVGEVDYGGSRSAFVEEYRVTYGL